MVKLCLVGALGRMGRQLVDIASSDTGVSVVSGVVSAETNPVSSELGSIPLSTGIPKASFDVVVDFSSPSGVALALEIARSRAVPLIVGTTGIDNKMREELKDFHHNRDCENSLGDLNRFCVFGAK